MERDSSDFRGLDTPRWISHTLYSLPHVVARLKVSFSWIAYIFYSRAKIEKVDMLFFLLFSGQPTSW